MCTRFVYNGVDMITGFNFDIDLNVWNHDIFKENERFYIGIKQPDGVYHSYHGVNKNGNVGTLLYVHGNLEANYLDNPQCLNIADLTEQFIKAKITFDEVINIVKAEKIAYAPDATMQAMLSDNNGRVLIIEPGIGFRLEESKFSLITNYSIIKPESTKPYVIPGDDRYERGQKLLDTFENSFNVVDGFSVLQSLRQEGIWATRVSFVYSKNKQAVYYVLNNDFWNVSEHKFL